MLHEIEWCYSVSCPQEERCTLRAALREPGRVLPDSVESRLTMLADSPEGGGGPGAIRNENMYLRATRPYPDSVERKQSAAHREPRGGSGEQANNVMKRQTDNVFAQIFGFIKFY